MREHLPFAVVLSILCAAFILAAFMAFTSIIGETP